MENFKAFDQKLDHQEPDHQLQKQSNTPNHSDQITQQHDKACIHEQKDPFLRYASSVFLTGTQEQQKGKALPVYQQSQLINPSQSLIEEYLTLEEQQGNCGRIASNKPYECYYQAQGNIGKALEILGVFYQRFRRKSYCINKNKLLQSLIDILACSSADVSNVTQEKNKIKEAFFKIKSHFHTSTTKRTQIRTSIPTFKKHRIPETQSVPKSKKIILSKNQEQGAKYLVGTLTFKMLQIESQSFNLIKIYIKFKRVLKFIVLVQRASLSIAFKCIKDNHNLHRQRHASKVLALSKSKGSLSKIKIHSLSSSSQKRFNPKKFSSQQNIQLEENYDFGSGVINSQIIENFDFMQLKSEIKDRCESNSKKIAFNNKIKKKSTRESMSQAQTKNSKKSFQSQHQLTQGVIHKIFSCKEPVTTKNLTQWEENSNQQHVQQIPTKKKINSPKNKRAKQKLECAKNITDVQLSESRKITLFPKQERRYLIVRTNLFQLPILPQIAFSGSTSHKDMKNQQMPKIYHLIPNGLTPKQFPQDQQHTPTMHPSPFDFQTRLNMNKIHSHKQIPPYINPTQKQQAENTTQIQTGQQHPQKCLFKTSQAMISKGGQFMYNGGYDGQKELQVNGSQSLSEYFFMVEPALFKPNSHKVKGKSLLWSEQMRVEEFVMQKQKDSRRLKFSQAVNFDEYYFNRQIKQSNSPRQGENHQNLSSQINKTTKNLKIESNHTTNPNKNRQQIKNIQYETEYIRIPQPHKQTEHHRRDAQIKDIKSLSPSVRFTSHNEPYKTGRFGSNNVSFHRQNSLSVQNRQQRVHSPSFVVRGNNPQGLHPYGLSCKNLHNGYKCSDMQPGTSLGTIPINTNQFTLNSGVVNNSSFILRNEGRSKLENFSHHQRPLSPQPNILSQHKLLIENLQRNPSFIVRNLNVNSIADFDAKLVTGTHHPPSNSFFSTLGSQGVPKHSNLTNQPSGPNLEIQNFGPFVGFSQQIINNPPSLKSPHNKLSTQSRQKIVSSNTLQTVNCVNRNNNAITKLVPSSNSPRYVNNKKIPQDEPMLKNAQVNVANPTNPRRGLNVMMSIQETYIQKPPPDSNLIRLNSGTRQKAISKQ